MNWTTVGWISYLVLWALVVIQVILTLALARLVGQLSRRNPPAGARVINPGPEIDSLVENWDGTDLFGNTVNVRFPRERGLFLLYVSPHCSVCSALIPSGKRFFKEISGEVNGAWIMVLGSRETQISYTRENGLNEHLVAAEEQLPPSWRVAGAPFGLWISASGQVKAKGMVNHREHLESLRLAARTGHPSIQSYLSALGQEEEKVREGP